MIAVADDVLLGYMSYDANRLVKLRQPQDMTILVLRNEEDSRGNLMIAELSKNVIATASMREACQMLGLVMDNDGEKVHLERRRNQSLIRPHLVISNINDQGLALLGKIMSVQETRDVPVVLYSVTDPAARVLARARSLGVKGVFPLRYEGYHLQLFTHKIDAMLRPITLRDNLAEVNKVIEQYGMGLITFLSRLAEIRCEYSTSHTSKVADYALAIAQALGLSLEKQKEVYFSALLHDLGKAHTPDSILFKQTRLTDEEYAIIKKHPEVGAFILQRASIFSELGKNAMYHHEFWDGRGTFGLSREDIPEVARIIAIADSYDAMTNDRIYRGIINVSDLPESLRWNSERQKDLFQFEEEEVDAVHASGVFKFKGSTEEVVSRARRYNLSEEDASTLRDLLKKAERERCKTPEEAYAEVLRCAGTQFDPNIVKKGFTPWFEHGRRSPDTSRISFFGSSMYMPKVTDIKTMPLVLVGEMEELALGLRNAGYESISVIRSIDEISFETKLLPQAFIFDHIPKDRAVLQRLQDDHYSGSYIPMIYYGRTGMISDEQEWRMISDNGFSDCYSGSDKDIAGLISFLDVRLKDRFLSEEIETNTRFIETMRADLIEVLKELVRENEDNIRGYNPEEPAEFAVSIAKELGLSKEQQDNIYISALIGAIGQMYLADEIHEKKEKGDLVGIRKIIVEKGLELLSSIPGFENVLPIIWNVYENFNGEDSLYGRSGNDIPIESKVLSVGTCFYGSGYNVAYIDAKSGSEFDPIVVDALLLWLSKNPRYVQKEKLIAWCAKTGHVMSEKLYALFPRSGQQVLS